MDKLEIKYSTYAKAIPPQQIRIKAPSWAGSAEALTNGAVIQPWHCLPFVEGSTHGLELVYQYETECQVVNDNGSVRFEWDYAKEPNCTLTGAEFIRFSPLRAAKYYLFNTRMDVQAPPGYVLRTEPHPRFFTDDTGTVPLAMIGHLQTEWYSRLLFVVFRAPRPGQRHVFRKGEPFAQILFVPKDTTYELAKMTAEEEAVRRARESAIGELRGTIADNTWLNSDDGQQDNHYKILARTFARDGMAGLDNLVRSAGERQQFALEGKSIAECLALGAQLMNEKKRQEAAAIYAHVLEQNPNEPEALNNMGICLVISGSVALGLERMAWATALQPRVPKYHSSLGEILRLLGRFQEAEAEFRWSLQLDPNDPGIWSVLGLTMAQQGRSAEGLQACRTALAIGIPLPAAHFRMGWILAQQRQYSDARQSFETALALDPSFTDAQRALQELPPNG